MMPPPGLGEETVGWLNRSSSRMGSSATSGAPVARSDDLIVEELGDELLVYDEVTFRAHCLGATAARVWRSCDGTTSSEAIAGKLGLDHAAVAQALTELSACKLLDSAATAVAEGGSTRRELTLRAAKAGAAAASVPLIVSVVAPLPVQAATAVFCASGCPQPCNSGSCGDCCTSAFHGCGCCNCGNGPKFCTPAANSKDDSTCQQLHGPDCHIACTAP
jgi:hypothetical protein